MPSQVRIKRHTRLLPALVFLLLLMSLVDSYRGWRILLIGLGGTWLLSYLWVRSLARNLRLTREMRYGWAQVGDQIEERFTLVNNGWAPGVWVEVIDHSTLPGIPHERVTGVGRFSQTRWRIERTCARRGLFTLGPSSLRCGDPFGLYSIELDFPGWTSLLVTPPIVPLPVIEVAPGGRAGQGRPRANAPERTVSAASVRQYVPGDSLREVHWPTSARRDKLYVRQFESTPASDWWIFLDLEARVQLGEDASSTAEHAIVLAASLADRGLREQHAVGLLAHAEDLLWLPPESGDSQRLKILHKLAVISTGKRSLAELLTRMQPRLDHQASIVIITPNIHADWIEALFSLTRSGAVPTVLLLDPISFGGSEDARSTMDLLASFGVTHYRIQRELLDQPQARPGHQGHWQWQPSVTGRAVPLHKPKDLTWKVLS